MRVDAERDGGTGVTEHARDGGDVDAVGRRTETADIRVLIAAGVLVPFVSVDAVLAVDGTVEIIYVELG
jgi:hypothetical protein